MARTYDGWSEFPDHVGSQDRRKSSLDALLGHATSRALTAKFYAVREGKSMTAKFGLRVIAKPISRGFGMPVLVG